MSEFKCAFCKHHIKGEPLWFKAAPTHPNESGCIEAMGAALATTERELVEVEALLGLAMKIGDATCWPLRSERDYYRRLAEERGRAYLHTLAERDEAHAAGRAAGLREAAEACDAQAESWPESPESWFADPGMRHEAVTRRAHRNEAKSCAAKIRRALAPPAAETPPAGVGHALSLGVCCAACYRDGKHSAPFRPMILCPKCGNKRCPRADSHANACTNSNEPGQVATPAAEPRDEGES